MRKILILAIIILPVIVLLTLPFRAVLPLFDLPDGLGQVQGTLWSGQANWNQPGHPPLQVAWRWSGGRDWLVEITDPGTHLEGRLRPGGALHLVDLSGRIELDRVDLAHWFRNTRPTGYLEVELDEAYLESGEIPRLRGQITWADARLEGGVHEHLGRVVIELEPGSEHQLARLRSVDTAAVILRGEVRADEQEYRADLWLRASADRPDLTHQLAGLGELQPDGQVRIELRGMLGW